MISLKSERVREQITEPDKVLENLKNSTDVDGRVTITEE